MISEALIKNHAMQNQQHICTIPTSSLSMSVNCAVSLLFVENDHHHSQSLIGCYAL